MYENATQEMRWCLQGEWKPAPNKEADELLKMLHDAQPPLEGVCLHASENEPPLPSRKALAALKGVSSGVDAEAIAGTLTPPTPLCPPPPSPVYVA